MMNGTRCVKCHRYEYARSIPGDVDPSDYVCDACRTRKKPSETRGRGSPEQPEGVQEPRPIL